MRLRLTARRDFDLAAFRRVAWQGLSVRFAPAAMARMQTCREAFLGLLEAEPDLFIYGVTSGYGQEASRRLDATERRVHAARPPLAAMTGFGPPLPERIARGIVFARLANYVEGHAAISPPLAEAVAALLDGPPLPALPSLGNQSAGEIVALSHLLGPLAASRPLAEKDALALINGSPCASALLADCVLAGETRLALAREVFALSAEALRAPPEAWDEALDELWEDPDQAAEMAELRRLLAGGCEQRRPYQAPVSWRIAPRVLGQAGRAQRQAGEAANRSLCAVTDNPVYIAPDANHPHGRVLASGGFHNAVAAPAMDTLAAAWADLALLADRHVSRLLDGAGSQLPVQLRAGDGYLGCLGFAVADLAERARACCRPSLLPGSEGGGFGQNDVASPVFSAWERQARVGELLEHALATLAVIASQALFVTERDAPPALGGLLCHVREMVPPLVGQRALGAEVGRLAERLHADIVAAPVDAAAAPRP